MNKDTTKALEWKIRSQKWTSDYKQGVDALEKLLNIPSVIRTEAIECAGSSANMRNTPEDREIFHVVSIVLAGIADKLEAAYEVNQKPASDGHTASNPCAGSDASDNSETGGSILK